MMGDSIFQKFMCLRKADENPSKATCKSLLTAFICKKLPGIITTKSWARIS